MIPADVILESTEITLNDNEFECDLWRLKTPKGYLSWEWCYDKTKDEMAVHFDTSMHSDETYFVVVGSGQKKDLFVMQIIVCTLDAGGFIKWDQYE